MHAVNRCGRSPVVKGVPVQTSTASRVDYLRTGEAEALQLEILQAHEGMKACFREMELVLALPELDASALTSVRLKLASIRLTRGPLITRVADVLAGKVTDEEHERLEQLRTSHQRL